MSDRTANALLDPAILRPAVAQAFRKLDPRLMWRNPVMFVVEVVSTLTTILLIRDLIIGAPHPGFAIQINIWLWFTVIFANFAEAVAEGRGKAQAASLRRTKTEAMARRYRPEGSLEDIVATMLRVGDVVLVETNALIPSDGEVIEGVASVNEAAITGESAPVIRESGGDRSAVTGGTTVVSDFLRIRITAAQGSTFIDRMIALVEGASRQKTPNEIALNILLAGLTLIFVLAVATLPSFATYAGGAIPVVVLVALFVTRIPTTIGALLSAIGIAGMDRLMRFNVMATSGRAVEAAGDVDTLLLDKTGTITSNLAALVRAQAITARARARTTEDLYQFSRKLAGIVSLDDLLWATAFQIASMVKRRVVLLLPTGADRQSLSVRGAYPPEDTLDDADLAAAQWSWHSNRPAGNGADTLPGAKWLFLPLRTSTGLVAVVGIAAADALLTPDQRRLLDALGDQAAVSIERIALAEAVDRSHLFAETERLRTAMLTSISHDLRTPLAAILGAASTLQSYRDTLDPATQTDLLATIAEEAERLGRFVANLLDMTRLESGAIILRTQSVDLGELVGSTLARVAKMLAHHSVVLDLAADLPLLALDEVLFEQVLFNLLDNAAKYAPAGSAIILRAWQETREKIVNLQVIDEGPGIPVELTERIFDKFFRVHASDRTRVGTGLGLAICRGFVEAMGGRITAGNRADGRGAVFSLRLPT